MNKRMQSTTITRSKLEMMDLDLSKSTSSHGSIQYSPKTVLDDHGDSLERCNNLSDAEDIFDVTDFLNVDLLDSYVPLNEESFDSVPAAAYWTESIDTTASADDIDSMWLNPLGWSSDSQNMVDQPYYYPSDVLEKTKTTSACDPIRYGFGLVTESMSTPTTIAHNFACMQDENTVHPLAVVQNNLSYSKFSNPTKLHPNRKGLDVLKYTGTSCTNLLDARDIQLKQLQMGSKAKVLGKKRHIQEIPAKISGCTGHAIKKKQRSSFSRHATTVLKAWLRDNILNPYPTEAQKLQLTKKIGISMPQLQTWFINARIRLWKPCIEDLYKAKEQEVNQMLKSKGNKEQETKKVKFSLPSECDGCDVNSANGTMQMIKSLQKLPNLKGPLEASVNKFFS